jgi:glutamate dehydrogenase
LHPDQVITEALESRLSALVDVAVKRRPDDRVLHELLPPYYRELPDVDADHRDLDDIYAVAVAHLALGRTRSPGATHVRVLSPDLDVDGWHSDRSVVLLVTDDAPFLVDSVRMVLDRNGLGTHLLVHPMLTVERDPAGELVGVRPESGPLPECLVEAWTQIEIDRCTPESSAQVAAEILQVINEVHRLIADFPAMRHRMETLAAEDPLLEWLASGQFVFLGAATYDRTTNGDLVVRPGTELGQLRSPHVVDPPPVPMEASDRTPVVISRSDAVSTIHRAVRRTCVSVRAPHGARQRFIGLLASSAYRQSVLSIPTIGDRVRSVLGLAHGGAETHTGRSIRNVLETLPRDLLFELDVEQLAHLVVDIVSLQERRIVRVFDVAEPVGQWSTILVYLPRGRFDAQVPSRVAEAVAAAYDSPYRDLESLVGTSSLARITFTVRRRLDGPGPDLERLAGEIDQLTTSWQDRLGNAAERQLAPGEARALLRTFAGCVPPAFEANVSPERAVADLVRIRNLLAAASPQTEPTACDGASPTAESNMGASPTAESNMGASPMVMDAAMSREVDAPAHEWRFRVYRLGQPATLSELLPLLAHLGLEALDERPYTFLLDGREVHLYDIGVRSPEGVEIDAGRHDEVLATFHAQVSGEVEADGLNRLVLLSGLKANEVAVLRGYVRYLRQIGFAFSQAYVEETLARLPTVARAVVELFGARFGPGSSPRGDAIDAARQRLHRVLDAIQVLDDDRICRTLVALVDATTRTNFFRSPNSIAFKFDPALVPELPDPRPRFEIFVSTPRVEGVHLRGGPIARGGLRWSDRREDFRTEVLGLVKAQMVKNAVIVPVGAKGGFVIKRAPQAPEELRAEVTSCYREFIGALLDLTDNVVDGEILPPPDTVVHDEPDAYLVVAADKGTATFSDLANSIAIERGFWLADAFASGGSEGYDHKAMGITARGAWESVRRHARVLGLEADEDPLTVVGVGDMSGDVFGNGMLRSANLRLVAAFDHRHIFIDPDPDPAVAWAERRRLFQIPRSSWGEYEVSKIGAGGGVFSRSAKSIQLSPQAREVLGIEAQSLTPLEVVSAILTAPVDLLWNGGIGTYVKASTETHADVGDRANDAVRVDAGALRCRMVGEGGNLGFTQLARVEFALAGGLIHTDAIDNSAGVDCSDHEVNIKILLEEVVAAGELTGKQRNELLASMTEEVAELVLDNNRAQTLALAIARRQALPMANVHARYLELLETEGWLDRSLEFLPTDKQIAERQSSGLGLTTPEFAVLIAYTKNVDVIEILSTDLPDDEALDRDLIEYFPAPLRARYRTEILHHRLRREIVATQVVNQMVNLSGISYDHRMIEETGASVADVCRAWVANREILGFAKAWSRIDELDRSVDLDTRLELFLECRRMAERCSLWLLRNRRPPLGITATVDAFRGPITELADGLHSVLRGPMSHTVEQSIERRVSAGVPAGLARTSAIWPLLHTGFDIAEIARRSDTDVLVVADVYWQVFDRLDLMWLWSGIGALARSDRWQTQARSALRDDLLAALSSLAGAVLADGFTDVSQWVEANERTVTRIMAMLTEIRRSESFELTTLSVALRQLRNLSMTAVASQTSR